MILEAILVLVAFITLVGLYFLGCVAITVFIAKQIVRWLKQ